ncbi:MAG: hypothetical protein KC593_21340 [Myxococcales bacterium]|nr:hypothetical protein [Myxococcales bacterium]MCB9629512.1 hypothetical protein [Sandaracinaceae bacterium]
MDSTILRKPYSPRPQTAYLPTTGTELWIYDEAHWPVLRESGVLDPSDPLLLTKYRALAKQGLVLGYGLTVAHPVTVTVEVGAPLTAEQLSELHHGHWLAPETGRLDAPSGNLCIESREQVIASRASTQPPPGRVHVPPGEYRVSVYRSDDAARERESFAWSGPQQVLMLTPAIAHAYAGSTAGQPPAYAFHRARATN